MYNTLPYVTVYDTMIEWKASVIVKQNFTLNFKTNIYGVRELQLPELTEERQVPGTDKTRVIRRKAETLDDLIVAHAQKLYRPYSTPLAVIEQDLRKVIQLLTRGYNSNISQ